MKSEEVARKAMSPEEVLEVVASGTFSELIGAIESNVVDFKGSPYRLGSPKQKLELAKDVSGLANGSGGIIVMGVGTCVLEGHPHEVAERIRSFDKALLEVKQYEDVIDKWIYPRLQVEIKWVPSSDDADKGVAYIRVPESQVGRKPFLTVSLLQEDDKRLENVVGFFQRKGDKVVHWSAEELHHAFKDGRRFDQHLSEIGKTLGKILSQSRTPDSHGVDEASMEGRITNAIEAVGLKDSISYVLVSYPAAEVEIAGLFESTTSDVVKLIDEPPQLRHAGFDISTHERSRIINGEFRRSVLRSYKVLDVWRDGTILSVGDGGEGFLCWGDYSKKEFLRVNTIALIESVYLFTLFVKRLFEQAEAPGCAVTMGLEIRNIGQDRKYGLPKAKPGSLTWQFNWDRDIVWAPRTNVKASKTWTWRDIAAERGAYELVSELYAKFGVEHQFVPYVKDHDGEKVIEVEKIKNLR